MLTCKAGWAQPTRSYSTITPDLPRVGYLRLDLPVKFCFDRIGQPSVIIGLSHEASHSQLVGPLGVHRIFGGREYNDRDRGKPFTFREPGQDLETALETSPVRQSQVEDDERWKWIQVPVLIWAPPSKV